MESENASSVDMMASIVIMAPSSSPVPEYFDSPAARPDLPLRSHNSPQRCVYPLSVTLQNWNCLLNCNTVLVQRLTELICLFQQQHQLLIARMSRFGLWLLTDPRDHLRSIFTTSPGHLTKGAEFPLPFHNDVDILFKIPHSALHPLNFVAFSLFVTSSSSSSWFT